MARDNFTFIRSLSFFDNAMNNKLGHRMRGVIIFGMRFSAVR
jgi:hypothetical protein